VRYSQTLSLVLGGHGTLGTGAIVWTEVLEAMT
jgi:hypothetical protein